jgi:hypothetical protein
MAGGIVRLVGEIKLILQPGPSGKRLHWQPDGREELNDVSSSFSGDSVPDRYDLGLVLTCGLPVCARRMKELCTHCPSTDRSSLSGRDPPANATPQQLPGGPAFFPISCLL